MATSRTAAAPLAAYVLHSYDWSETSLIVELFTRERGRVAVAAKGAKRPTSQLRAVLLPFQPLAAHLGRTPADEAAEIHTLKTAEWVGGAPLLAAPALFPAFYLNELLMKGLARQDPHPALFDAYAETLAALAEGGDEAAALRAFELLLLRETGHLPALDAQTLTLAPLQASEPYRLVAEGGLRAAHADDAAWLPGQSWRRLAASLADEAPWTATLTVVVGLPGEQRGSLRRQLGELLHYHGGGATLRTRQLLQDAQRLMAT